MWGDFVSYLAHIHNAGIKKNISGRAFGGSTGIYLGVYNDLQVSSESASVGTRGFRSIKTRRISAQGNMRARSTRYTAPASKQQRGPTSRRSLSIGS